MRSNGLFSAASLRHAAAEVFGAVASESFLSVHDQDIITRLGEYDYRKGTP